MTSPNKTFMAWAGAAVLSAITAAGGYLAATKTSQPDSYRALSEESSRIREAQREEISELKAERRELRNELRQAREINLETSSRLSAALLQVSASVSTTPRATIRRFLRSLRQTPAWCNEFMPEQNTVRMLFINPAYERFYDITDDAYRDKTPIEVWGERLGNTYLANDLKVIETKDSELVTERVRALGKEFMVDFTKFYVPLPGGVELACGIQLKTIDTLRIEQSGNAGAMAANDDFYMRVANW